MVRILVAGAAGFIGSHLCERLLLEGCSVIGIDNLITGNLDNIKDLYSSDFKFSYYDVTDPIKLSDKIDYVVNLACPASPPKYLQCPIETMRACSQGTFNLLELARKNNAKFLLASTSEIYGDPLEHPQSETYNGNVSPLIPRSVYNEGKRYAEALTMTYHRQFGLDTRIVRIFNTYGPRMDPQDGRVISNFIVSALANQPITVYGDGQQTRSFCFISDLIDGIVSLMQIDSDHLPVNLGSAEENSIIFIANLIKVLTGKMVPIIFSGLPEGDPKRRCPDLTKAIEMKWVNQVDLYNGLKMTIDYFKYYGRSL